MQHEVNAPHNAAKAGCYLCTNPNSVVVTDAYIEGEGTLVICTGCLSEANRVGQMGKARIKRAEKRDLEDRKARGAA